MALDYAKLFGDLGKIIARINSYTTLAQTTLPADLLAMLTQFGTTWLPEEGVAASYEGLKEQVKGWRDLLGSYADRRLLDRATVTDELGLTAPSLDEVLVALDVRLREAGKTFKRCSVTAGPVSARALPPNAGTGTAFVTTTLDGHSSPGGSMPANVYYDGQPSQLAVPSETVTLDCVADSAADGLAEGAELFQVSGGPLSTPQDYHAEGSGPGPTFRVANGESLLAGRDFDSFSGNVPAGWSLDAGTAGTHCAQDTSVYYRNAVRSSLKLTGGAAEVTLTQPVSRTSLHGRRRYLLSVTLKASAAAPASASLRVGFTGTGYAAGAGEEVLVRGPDLPTSWTVYASWLTAPTSLPDDLGLEVSLRGAPSTVSVWVSSLALAPAVYHGGVGVGVVAGPAKFLKGDRLSFTLANDGAGLFQSFWRRRYGRQLPSTASGSTPPALLAALWLLPQTVTDGISDALVS